ncbi:hypothetical protein I4P60_012730 [Clostridioides difficile]
MAKEKGSFKEFLSAIAPEHQAFVEKLNTKLIEQGCDLVIKDKKRLHRFIPTKRRKQ